MIIYTIVSTRLPADESEKEIIEEPSMVISELIADKISEI
tara:strand:+ start:602 stop:721 length:120 start_codon:yes stop_codon:yes gene_type:complete